MSRQKYLDRQKPDKLWLTLVFPQEKPPKKHLHLWRQVLYAIAPRGWVQNWVERFIKTEQLRKLGKLQNYYLNKFN
jgi:hypothetical protein